MEQVKKIIKLCSFFTVQTNLKYISRCPLFEWRLILTCNMNTGLVFEWWSELQAKYCLLFRCHSINGSYNVRAGLKHSSMTAFLLLRGLFRNLDKSVIPIPTLLQNLFYWICPQVKLSTTPTIRMKVNFWTKTIWGI